MGTIINEHNFTDSENTDFNINDFEFEGFFAHLDFLPTKDIKTVNDIKTNQAVSTYGRFVFRDGNKINIKLGKIIPTDEAATETLKKSFKSDKLNRFACVIAPDSQLKFDGYHVPFGTFANGHFTREKGQSIEGDYVESMIDHPFYGTFDNVKMDSGLGLYETSQIESNLPVDFVGDFKLYDRKENGDHQINRHFGTHKMSLGLIEPLDEAAANSLKNDIDNSKFNLLVMPNSSLRFEGPDVPTGIVTNNTHAKLFGHTTMKKGYLNYRGKIELDDCAIANCKLLKDESLDESDKEFFGLPHRQKIAANSKTLKAGTIIDHANINNSNILTAHDTLIENSNIDHAELNCPDVSNVISGANIDGITFAQDDIDNLFTRHSKNTIVNSDLKHVISNKSVTMENSKIIAPKLKPLVIQNRLDMKNVNMNIADGFVVNGPNRTTILHSKELVHLTPEADTIDFTKVENDENYDKIRQPKHGRYHAVSNLINKIKSKIPVKKQSQHKEDESEWQL